MLADEESFGEDNEESDDGGGMSFFGEERESERERGSKRARGE